MTRSPSRRLWIIQIVPELPRWTLATESDSDPDELSVIPIRFATRSDAVRALTDSRERIRIIEEFDRIKHIPGARLQPSGSVPPSTNGEGTTGRNAAQ